MISTILVCAAHSRERDYWMNLAARDGAQLDAAKRLALFPALQLELRFMVFERAEDADRLVGLELDGVLNLEAVTDQPCRSMIYARIRPFGRGDGRGRFA